MRSVSKKNRNLPFSCPLKERDGAFRLGSMCKNGNSAANNAMWCPFTNVRNVSSNSNRVVMYHTTSLDGVKTQRPRLESSSP
jgi:hypothetical protein